MKYYKPKDFKKIINLLNPEEFLKYMIKAGELKQISEDYSKDCKLLCHNSIGWVVLQLNNTMYIYDVKIHKGKYYSYEHSWVEIGDYYVDLTLAQFEEDAPKLAITKIKEAKGYEIGEVMDVETWCKNEIKHNKKD